MPAAERDLTIEAGSHWRMRFTWHQPREKDTDPLVPYNLSGAEVFMQLRQRYGSPILLDLDSSAKGGILVEPKTRVMRADGTSTDAVTFTGCVEVRMRPEQTAAVAVRRGRYDLLVQFPAVDKNKPQDVEVYRILQGAFEISRLITRPVPAAPALTANTVLVAGSTIPTVQLAWARVPSTSYYDVLRNGVIVASTRAISLRDVPAVGAHIYTVRAYNVFGQTTDSDPVAVQVTDTAVVTLPDTSTGSGGSSDGSLDSGSSGSDSSGSDTAADGSADTSTSAGSSTTSPASSS